MLISLITERYLSTIIVVVVILLAVELLVRNDFFYELGSYTPAQEPVEIFDFGFELVSEPEVIILGNSLTRNAISIFETTELAASEKHFLLNLSQSGGTMTDQLWLYQMYREKFQHADILVIGIDFRSFDDSASSVPEISSRFRRYASLSQRMEIDDWSDRTRLLVGGVWKTWDSREEINDYMWDMYARRFPRTGEPVIDELGRIALRGSMGSTDADDIVAGAATNYIFAKGIQFEAFAELVRIAKEDSLNIILLDAPATNVYLDQVGINIGDEVHKLYDAIEKESGTSIIQIRLTSSDCPTIGDCFIDYGHMNANGSRIYSGLLVEHLDKP